MLATFGRRPSKFVCNWLSSFRKEDFLNIPHLYSILVMAVILEGDAGHNFRKEPAKYHSIKVWSNWLCSFRGDFVVFVDGWLDGLQIMDAK